MTRSVVLALALAAAAGACGGGDGGANEQTTAAPSTSVGDVAASTAPTTAGGSPTSTVHDDATDDDAVGTVPDEPSPDEPVRFGDHLEPGMCFDDSFDDQGEVDHSGEPDVVDCEAPHDNEVVMVDSLDGGAGAAYPDDEMWESYFGDVCGPAVQDFLGIDGIPSGVNAYFLAPDEEEWAAGSRSVPCVVYLPDAKLAGSVQGAGDDIMPAGFPDDAPLPDGIRLSSAGTIEESYSPSDSFTDDAGIDVDGFRVATFEGGEVDAFKQALEGAFAGGGWEVTLEDHWSGGVATASYALVKDGTRMIVEIWELEGGDSRLHYFYGPT